MWEPSPFVVKEAFVIYYPEIAQFVSDAGARKLYFSDLPRLYSTEHDAMQTISRLRGIASPYEAFGFGIPDGTTWGDIVDQLRILPVRLDYRSR